MRAAISIRSIGPILTILPALVAALIGCGEGGLANGEESPSAAVERHGRNRGTVAVERLELRVVAVYPHDRQAFTQGLVWHHGRLFESTGQYGRSSLREIDLERGSVLRSVSLPQRLFGEGLALVPSGATADEAEDRLIQLTWRARTALVWSLRDFSRLRELRYSGEGWGLCFDGEHLVMSDGSSELTFRAPEDLSIQRRVRVQRNGAETPFLNELECVDGTIYANVWMSDEILRIDARTGQVSGVVDASGLLSAEERATADVLNGIAYRPETGTFLITGKYWPKVFEVEIVRRP